MSSLLMCGRHANGGGREGGVGDDGLACSFLVDECPENLCKFSVCLPWRYGLLVRLCTFLGLSYQDWGDALDSALSQPRTSLSPRGPVVEIPGLSISRFSSSNFPRLRLPLGTRSLERVIVVPGEVGSLSVLASRDLFTLGEHKTGSSANLGTFPNSNHLFNTTASRQATLYVIYTYTPSRLRLGVELHYLLLPCLHAHRLSSRTLLDYRQPLNTSSTLNTQGPRPRARIFDIYFPPPLNGNLRLTAFIFAIYFTTYGPHVRRLF